MKKFLVLLSLTALMLFAWGSTALAGSFYFDYQLSGSWELTDDIGDNYEGDLTGFFMGFNNELNNMNLNFEFGVLSEGAPEGYSGTVDLTIMDLRAEFLMVDSDPTSFSIGMGYLYLDEDSSYISGFGLVAGFSTGSDQFLFKADLGITLEATLEGYVDASILYLKLRGIYLFSENSGISLAYRSYNITYPDDEPIESNLTGLSLGLSFYF